MYASGLHGGGGGSACPGLEDTSEVDRWRGEGRIGPKHLAAGIKVTDEGKEKPGLGGRREGEKGGRGRGKVVNKSLYCDFCRKEWVWHNKQT